ncbi:putative zinc finger CCCH domain-containing protein 51 [Panicum virgatum]|uniref:putative zinc finger CCCH domain-containing protein 51 n=1 Tax=Panicum virgatum TaxID=38727 RepID=UPI0019D66805|nr:putative zinc finger CCCH domain-containing protein 51 [Panicum virgatum]
MRQVQTPESLPMLEKEISELLLSLRPPKVPVESLANIYIKRYGKPLKFGDSCTKGQQNDHSFTCLLTKLCTTRVIERQGQCYIVPLEEAPKYLDDGFKLVMSPAGNGSDQIYITFGPKSTFTKEDAWNYFSQYGPVNDVRIPLRKKRMFGYVIFLYPGTAKRVLSERSPRNPHFICGDQVFVKAWKEKHELEKLAEKDAHSNSGANNASGLSSVIHEHQTGEDDSTAESSPVQSHLDEAPAARDR